MRVYSTEWWINCNNSDIVISNKSERKRKRQKEGIKMSTKAEQAITFHDKGYNCAQAVACSFCKEFGVDEEEMFRIAERCV